MNKKTTGQQIAYRCPECGVACVGFLGALSSVSDMLRLKCECEGDALEVIKEERGRVKLNVPCVFCKDKHTYILSSDILAREQLTSIACPHSNHDILFIGSAEDISPALERSASELSLILSSFEADELSDIQPQDIDTDTAPPDPGVFDVINFVVRDLEATGELTCPCKEGPYEVRFTEDGAEVVCSRCGASYVFFARSAASAESYLSIDSIKLT